MAAALASPAARADEPAPVPDDETLVRDGAVIGTIEIRTVNIFDRDDPKENKAVFRAADRLHRTTRERVIREQLLVHEGDRYDPRLCAESERVLRASGYLYEATVRPVRFDGERVDLEVRTRDVWTLKAGVGFGRAGGVNKTRFGLHDSNFLGTGKSVKVIRTSGVDRTETLYGYDDRLLFGTHGHLKLDYSDNSDGKEERLVLERPFFSLDTRWALGLQAHHVESVESLYALGVTTGQFGRKDDKLDVSGGFSKGRRSGATTRWSFGYTFDRSLFSETAGPLPEGGLPPEHTLAYPWAGFDYVQDGYTVFHDVDKIGRAEDLNLGREAHLRLGWSAPAFGADRSAAVFESSFGQSLAPGPAQTVLLDASLSGRWESAGARNVMTRLGARWLLREPGGSLLSASLRLVGASHLDPETQILLGGDNGLRGYPLRYALGDRTLLMTIEQRFYRDREIFHLVRVGGAVFFDAGEAIGGAGHAGDLDTLRDIGIGLRFGQSRSAHAAIVKIDLAYPLDGDRSVRKPQVLVTTGDTF